MEFLRARYVNSYPYLRRCLLYNPNQIHIFVHHSRKRNRMLGINEKRELITGPFAHEIRERMRRIQSGKLSEKDLEEIRKHKQILKGITIVWK